MTPHGTNALQETAQREIFLASNYRSWAISADTQTRLNEATTTGVSISVDAAGVPLLWVDDQPVYASPQTLQWVQREIDGIKGDKDADVVALFGFGLGYHAEMLERRFRGRIVVYDPSLRMVKKVLSSRLFSFQRTSLVTDPLALQREVQSLLQYSDHQVVAAAIPFYRIHFPDELQAFQRVLNEAMASARILDNTAEDRLGEWIGYIAQNFEKVLTSPSLDSLRDRFSGRPGILVAAGPSLDKNVALLREAMGRSLIISANAAATPLARSEVVPDMVAVVESLDLRAQLAELPWLSEVSLIPAINAFPGFFDLPARHIFPLSDYSLPCSDWFAKAFGWSDFPSGGSVACSIFGVLYALGCDPIILVGQDLAYTEGKSYTEKATFGRQRMAYDPQTQMLHATERCGEIETIRASSGLDLMLKIKAIEVEAYGGEGVVPSSSMFNLFRTWFENAAQTFAKDRTLINATEGGAKIRGFVECSLRDTLKQYLSAPLDANAIINAAVASWKPPVLSGLRDIVQADFARIEAAWQHAVEGMEAAKDARLALESTGFACAEPELRKLSHIEREMRERGKACPLLDAYLVGRINRLRRARMDDVDADATVQAIQSLRRTETLFATIAEGAAELQRMFEGPRHFLDKSE